MSKIHHFHTSNNTPDNTKSVSIETLNARLADLIDLALVTKQAHWNLKGTNFIGVHEMLDGFRGGLDGFIDTAAERAVQLGGVALGTVQTVHDHTNCAPYPTNIFTVLDHIKALAERYGVVANKIREAIKTTAEAGDDDTADLFTEISRGLDKNLWFLEAHLQAEAGPRS
ncbi:MULTISPECIES: DNA starvation/stationary phase protection protein Dps [Bombella]|uniref:DNA starvation/stationary phase protection protein Dps n=1 Tax=Bombella pollinis TaxID=2967337 RepID=A0ABT3WN46_9PROT|nr:MULTISPECIES: DNA starvation/stationary phase protection protein Dps [Bombella]MCT6836876.1 DNA starvation/stationary phase protection protein Dps [Bifidobacteriales bacterium]MCT6854903.1 DNA starvation/stationary phase protection protein Dps [Bombella apis]MCX5620416.1 DNA starvation/stationary phase protection protein Dps [Bombella pollinis]MUG03954.1 DNA starvation/stationary phase protection protein Dps [Bombella sp. ESL0378]MUG90955.1 DNA starvation/stationary phase protection protein